MSSKSFRLSLSLGLLLATRILFLSWPPAYGESLESPPLQLNLTRQQGLYTLGPGDRITVSVVNEQNLSGEQQVLVDGSIHLPLIGTVLVQGLTLEQASDIIEQRLAIYLKYPAVALGLSRARTARITVVGEVNRPGSYSISPNRGNTGATNVTEVNATTLREDVPRVTQLIQLAGGITQQADIRTIKVTRREASGTTQTFNIDLWALLQNGDPDDDLVVFDGDSIQVPTAKGLDLGETAQLRTANFSPDDITVNVVGEVKRPGQLKLDPNTPMTTALLAAGGFTPQALTDSVQMIRLNPNGSVTTRELLVDLTLGLDDQLNPPLQNSDILIVQASSLAETGDTLAVGLRPLNLLLNPIRELGGILRVFGVDF